MPKTLEHATNLSVLSFTQGEGNTSAGKAVNRTRQRTVPRSTVVGNPYPFLQPIDFLVRNFSIDFYLVLLFVFITRMHKIIGKPSIVRKKDKPRTFLIKSSDRKYPLRYFHDIQYGFFSRLLTSGYDSPGFVQHIIYQGRLLFDDAVVKFYGIQAWTNRRTDSCDLPINTDESRSYVFLGFAPGTYSRLAQIFMQPDRGSLRTPIIGDIELFFELVFHTIYAVII